MVNRQQAPVVRSRREQAMVRWNRLQSQIGNCRAGAPGRWNPAVRTIDTLERLMRAKKCLSVNSEDNDNSLRLKLSPKQRFREDEVDDGITWT